MSLKWPSQIIQALNTVLPLLLFLNIYLITSVMYCEPGVILLWHVYHAYHHKWPVQRYVMVSEFVRHKQMISADLFHCIEYVDTILVIYCE